MKELSKGIAVFFAILIAATFLSGAGVMFSDTWFSAPVALSKFVTAIATQYFFVYVSLRIVKFFIK